MSFNKKMPIGTQRVWADRTYIKTHDNQEFDDLHSPWLPMPEIPKLLLDLTKQMDSKNSILLKSGTFCDGDLWFANELKTFSTSSGKEFTEQEFKKFTLNGRPIYSFALALQKRYLQPYIDYNEMISDKIVERAIQDEVSLKGVTAELVKDVKRENPKVLITEEELGLTIKDVEELSAKLNEICAYLQNGLESLTGEQRECVDEVNEFAVMLNPPYYNIPIKEVNELYAKLSAKVQEKTGSLWGVVTTLSKRMNTSYGDYLRKFKIEIEKEAADELFERLGVPYDTPDVDKFYGAIEREQNKDLENLDRYVGQAFMSSDGKLRIVKKISEVPPPPDWDEEDIKNFGDWKRYEIGYSDGWIDMNLNKENFLKKIYSSNSPFSFILQLRFSNLYNKTLKGWNGTVEELAGLKLIERTANFLPPGHFIDNDSVKIIEKEYHMGAEGYAYYNGSEEVIFFSEKCLSHAANSANLETGEALPSTIIHEIGHALSVKLEQRKSYLYKRFAVECGWSWQQFRGGNERDYLATSGDAVVKRSGGNSNVPLISQYAHQSPEEAFAENYSFYTQYKKQIDNFLQTGSASHVEASVKKTPKSSDFKFDAESFVGQGTTSTSNDIDCLLRLNNRNDSHFSFTTCDPLKVKHLKPLDIERIKYHKSRKGEGVFTSPTPYPILTIRDNDVVTVPAHKDFSEISEANKYLRRQTPTFQISSDCYKLLKNNNYTDQQISDYTAFKFDGQLIPSTRLSEKEEKGLYYKGTTFVPSKTIIKNKGVLSAMKAIWECEELKKSLNFLGEGEKISEIERKFDSEEISVETYLELLK